MNNQEEIAILDDNFETHIRPHLADTNDLSLSFSGEALASRHSLRILKSFSPSKYPLLKINLASNLSTLTQEKWQSLGDAAQCIKRLFISLDGASPKTAEKLRRGLKWHQAIEALEFIRILRQRGDIEHVFMSFLLQKDNYKELQQIIEIASRYCIDAIQIAPLVSHGSYTNEEFAEVNICHPQHALFPDASTAITEAKQLHERMLQDKVSIIASGRSVPEINWRIRFQEPPCNDRTSQRDTGNSNLTQHPNETRQNEIKLPTKATPRIRET